jgi:FkbM family methyltransferase
VFNQVFVEGQYARLPLRGDERLILDCGANVGYASAYFLSRCPQAHVVAVEPEPDNFRMLERNLQPYGDRVTVIQSAVWPRLTRLRMVSGLVGWEARVEETTETGADTFAALDLPTLLAPFPGQRVDILKVDIEGAEEHLFGGQTEEWIGRIDVCAAELHGPECEKAFHGLFVEKEFECYQRGELTIAVRRHGKGLPLKSLGTVVAAVPAV